MTLKPRLSDGRRLDREPTLASESLGAATTLFLRNRTDEDQFSRQLVWGKEGRQQGSAMVANGTAHQAHVPTIQPRYSFEDTSARVPIALLRLTSAWSKVYCLCRLALVRLCARKHHMFSAESTIHG